MFNNKIQHSLYFIWLFGNKIVILYPIAKMIRSGRLIHIAFVFTRKEKLVTFLNMDERVRGNRVVFL